MNLKSAYGERAWTQSSEKEQQAMVAIHKVTGIMPVCEGFGAGTGEELEGFSKDHGSEPGHPDLRLPGTNIFFEISGPLSEKVRITDPIWINITKWRWSRDRIDWADVIYVHALPNRGGVRCIWMNKKFHYTNFPVDTKVVRGSHPLKHLIVPAKHECVITWAEAMRLIAWTTEAWGDSEWELTRAETN